MALEDKLDVNLNQNLWALVLAYAFLGAAEYWDLNWLRCLSLIMAVPLSIFVLVSMLFYTIHYCVRKCIKTRGIWTRKVTQPRRTGN